MKLLFLYVFLFICCFSCFVESAIDEVKPSVFLNKGPFKFSITGFGITDSTFEVRVNNVVVTYTSYTATSIDGITVTKEIVEAADQAQSVEYFIEVSLPPYSSFSTSVAGLKYPTFVQENDIIYAVSRGYDIVRGNLFSYGSSENMVYTTYLNDTTVSFRINTEMIRNQEFSFWSLNKLLLTEKYSFPPIVEYVSFYDTYVEISGYYYSTYTQLKINDYLGTLREPTNGQSALFDLPADFFLSDEAQLNVALTTLPTTSVPTPSSPNVYITSRAIIYNVQPGTAPDKLILNIKGNLLGLDSKLIGSSNTYSFNSISNTMAVFTPEPSFKCDVYYLGSKFVARQSNSKALCPIPQLYTIAPRPDPLVGGKVTISGHFLSTDIYDGAASTTFEMTLSDGTKAQCSASSTVDSNLLYTTTCDMPPGKGFFTFTAKGRMGGYSDSIESAYDTLITSVSSTDYGTPGQVTIVGENFISQNLFVSIGGSQCTDAVVSQDAKQITCLFQSDAQAPSTGLLEVYLRYGQDLETTKLIFKYKSSNVCVLGSNGEECSGQGTCNQETKTCQCNKGWDNNDCSVVNPVIKSSTSTKYGTPGPVTIVGENFVDFNIFISIGGSRCGNPTISQDLSTIVCLFESDVPVDSIDEKLSVLISINSMYITSNKIFTYTSSQSCPTGLNGQVCSSHGTCNPQFTCVCDKGWETSDCSVQSVEGNESDDDSNSSINDSTSLTSGTSIWKLTVIVVLCLTFSLLL